MLLVGTCIFDLDIAAKRGKGDEQGKDVDKRGKKKGRRLGSKGELEEEGRFYPVAARSGPY